MFETPGDRHIVRMDSPRLDFFRELGQPWRERGGRCLNASVGNPVQVVDPGLDAESLGTFNLTCKATYRSASGEAATRDAICDLFASMGISEIGREHVVPGLGVTHLFSLALADLHQRAS